MQKSWMSNPDWWEVLLQALVENSDSFCVVFTIVRLQDHYACLPQGGGREKNMINYTSFKGKLKVA